MTEKSENSESTGDSVHIQVQLETNTQSAHSRQHQMTSNSARAVNAVNSSQSQQNNSTNLHIILDRKQYHQIEPICASLLKHTLETVDNLVKSYYLHYDKLLEELFSVLAHPSDPQHRLTAALLLVLPFVNSSLINQVSQRYVDFDKHDLFCPSLVFALLMDRKLVSVDMKCWILCTICNVVEAQHDKCVVTRVKDHYAIVHPCLQILQCAHSSYRMKRYSTRILHCEIMCGVSARQNLKDLHAMTIILQNIPLLESQDSPPDNKNTSGSNGVNERLWLIIISLKFLYCAFQYEEMWEWPEYIPMPAHVEAALEAANNSNHTSDGNNRHKTPSSASNKTSKKSSTKKNGNKGKKSHSHSKSEVNSSNSTSGDGSTKFLRVLFTPKEFIEQLKLKCECLVKFTYTVQIKVAAELLLEYPLSVERSQDVKKKERKYGLKRSLPIWDEIYEQKVEEQVRILSSRYDSPTKTSKKRSHGSYETDQKTHSNKNRKIRSKKHSKHQNHRRS